MGRDFPSSPVVKTQVSTVGVQVQYLVRELRFHRPYGASQHGHKKKKKKKIGKRFEQTLDKIRHTISK